MLTQSFKRDWMIGGLGLCLLPAVVWLATCGGAPTGEIGELGGYVALDGSSTVFPISEAVAEEFREFHPRVRVTVGVSGTGGGFKKFTRREIDIGNASRPIKPSELAAAQQSGVEFLELPIAYDGIAVVVNRGNEWAREMTVSELNRLWQPEAQGKVTRWNQIRVGWPDRPIKLFGAGVDSGTYDYFTQAVSGQEGASRGDFTASEDDNVLVQGVASDVEAMGFFGFAYYEENRHRLRALAIDDENPDNGAGPIAPTTETVGNGTYQPLSRPVFIYVRKDALDKPQVEGFVRFYLENAAQLSREVGYIALPETTYRVLLDRLDRRVAGSVFGGEGSQVGVTVDDLLRRETTP